MKFVNKIINKKGLKKWITKFYFFWFGKRYKKQKLKNPLEHLWRTERTNNILGTKV